MEKNGKKRKKVKDENKNEKKLAKIKYKRSFYMRKKMSRKSKQMMGKEMEDHSELGGKIYVRRR